MHTFGDGDHLILRSLFLFQIFWIMGWIGIPLYLIEPNIHMTDVTSFQSLLWSAQLKDK